MSYGQQPRGPPGRDFGPRRGEYDYGREPDDRLNRRRSPVYDDYPVGGVPPIDRRPSPPPSFYRGRSPPPYGNRPRSRSPMRFARSRSPMRRYRSPSPFRNGGPRYPPPGPDGPLPPLNDMPLGGPPYADAYPPPRGMSPSRPFHPAGSRFSPPPRPYDRGPPPFDDRFDYRARSPDRDRDFGRRPFRSQSPPPFRGEPPYRGRSRERDVYDYDRNMQGWPPSPPRREMTPEGPEGRLLPNPNDSERLLPFSAWTRWFWQVQPEIAKEEDTNHPGAKVEDQPVVGLPFHYNKYKESFKARQLWTLYLVHKDQGWFKDRYSNERTFANMRIDNVKRGKADTVRNYIVTLNEGQWDEINYEASKACENKTLPNGMAVCGPGKPQVSDPDVIEIEQPPKQLFIKTVHSNHSRSALEEAFRRVSGYQYLALSDPSPKKQYTRVGWIQFKPTANMDSAHGALDKVKVGGFQLNMVKNSEPFIGRARFTPSLSCTVERMQHDAQQAKAMAIKLESDLFVAPIQDADEDMDNKMEGMVKDNANELEEGASGHVTARIEHLWEQKGLNKAEAELSIGEATEKVRIELDHWLSYLRNALHTCYYCVAPTDYAEELYRKCIRHLRSPIAEEKSETQDEGKDVVMADADNARGWGRNAPKRKAHDRSSKADVWAEKRWSDNVDHKIKLVILPRDKIELEDYGAKQKEDYPPYKRIIQTHISVDDPKKSRCTICSKPFKAAEFVARHIVSRHPEIANDLPDFIEFEERVNKDYPMFNNFALDPQHLPPTSNYPASIDERLPRMLPEHLPTSREPTRRSDHHHRGDDHGRSRPLHARLGGFAGGGPDGDSRQAPRVKEDPRAKRGKISYVDLDPKAAPEPVVETGGLPW